MVAAVRVGGREKGREGGGPAVMLPMSSLKIMLSILIIYLLG